MNKRFFTSDFHLGSSNIIKYANRPFSSATEMTNAIIDGCNRTARDKSDIVFHCGDFALWNSDSHDGETGKDESSLLCGISDIKDRINASFALIDGNHDRSNKVESHMKSMTIDLNQNYRCVYVSHYPSDHKFYYGPHADSSCRPKIALCGHVHQKWLLKYDAEHNVLNVNVGVDVWNYMPVRDAEITEMLDFVLANHKFDYGWCQTRSAFDSWARTVKSQIKSDSAKRRMEKKLAKGLTPEECERRKTEAMRAKGILRQ